MKRILCLALSFLYFYNPLQASSPVVVYEGFDDLHAQDLRFLEEASQLGELTVLVWPDQMIQRQTGSPPKFPLLERLYLLNAVRYVSQVTVVDEESRPNQLPSYFQSHIWVDRPEKTNNQRQTHAEQNAITYRLFSPSDLTGFASPPPLQIDTNHQRIVATGCFDWFHSGHVRFFEEVSTHGDLYVIVGNDANVRLLKGAGHPLFNEAERHYIVNSIKYVKQALISSGTGWLDADPEIQKIQPHIYAVNEDGDKGGKREYCQKLGIEYMVLKRLPALNLPIRSSTDLRGF